MSEHFAPCLGLDWVDGLPSLSCGEQRTPAEPGGRLRLQVGARRSCVGAWVRGEGRRGCPEAAALNPNSKDPQCRRCAAVDSGRRLARDAWPDDGRTYRLYLAWFGGGLVKVGLTAAERGTVRPLEQGALLYGFVAEGGLTAVRGMEQAVSGAGLATERVRAEAKIPHWWTFEPEAGADLLRAAAKRMPRLPHAPRGLRFFEPELEDLSQRYGLRAELPQAYRAVRRMSPGATLNGKVTAAAGKLLLLAPETADAGETAWLCDSRLLAGWGLNLGSGPAEGPTPALGVRVCPPRPQDMLF